MIHQGLTDTEYQNNPFFVWDPAVHAIANSAQAFPEKWKDTNWLFVPVLGQFFTRVDGRHPLFVAASTLFTPERWEEIEDWLEEHADVHHLLRRANFKKLRRKVQRVRDKGLITTAEAQSLASVVAHFPVKS